MVTKSSYISSPTCLYHLRNICGDLIYNPQHFIKSPFFSFLIFFTPTKKKKRIYTQPTWHLLSVPSFSAGTLRGLSKLPLWRNQGHKLCLFNAKTWFRKINIQPVVPLKCLWNFAKPVSLTDYREFSFSLRVCNPSVVLGQPRWAGSCQNNKKSPNLHGLR